MPEAVAVTVPSVWALSDLLPVLLEMGGFGSPVNGYCPLQDVTGWPQPRVARGTGDFPKGP